MALRATAASRGKSRGGIVGVVFLVALALLVLTGAVNAQTIEIVKDIYVDEPAIWANEYRSEWQFDVTGPTTRTETIGGDETTGAFSVTQIWRRVSSSRRPSSPRSFLVISCWRSGWSNRRPLSAP